PEQKYLALISAGKSVSTGTLDTLFKQLKPVQPSVLTGEWIGGQFGLPTVAPHITKHSDWLVKKIAWGKVFHADGSVDPFVLLDPGVKVCVVVEAEFCGVVSAAIVSSKIPFIDYFRYVDDDTVAGLSCIGSATLAKYLGIPTVHFFIKKRRSAKL
ncbi:hypothetical protein B0H19DRAFT_972862, partial [Mycena capillaripes]